MEPLERCIADALDAVGHPLTRFDEVPDGGRPLYEPSLVALVQTARGADAARLSGAIAALVPGLQASPDFFRAARLAQVVGVLVEWGGNPTLAVPAILDRLELQLPAALRFAERLEADHGVENPERAPEEVLAAAAPHDFQGLKAWRGLRPILLAAMTMLARAARERPQARTREPLMAQLAVLHDLHSTAWFVAELLNVVDDEGLLVLHPAAGTGFDVVADAVRNNFHLFTLLQCELIGRGHLPGPPPNPGLCAVARGDLSPSPGASDEAAFHYFQWPALQPDGRLEPLPWSVWGEQSPRDILPFEGRRVLLLGPPVFAARGWDAAIFAPLHDALRSGVRVRRVLEPEEVTGWLERIRATPR